MLQFWDVALEAEASIRGFLVERKIQIIKREDFDLSLIADGMKAGTIVRTLQAHYGIFVCGSAFGDHDRDETERKYEKAIKITERIAMIGCSSKDNLPYFNASDYVANFGLG